MALHVDQVAAVIVRRAAPEVAEADVVQQCRRLEARDMAAELGGFLVRAQNNRHCVPANRRPDLVLDLAVARGFLFLSRRDGVAIGRGGKERRHRAGAQRFVAQLAQQMPGPLRPDVCNNGVQRVDPFLGFARVVVLHRSHVVSWLPCSV
jgi:hypothetical protein